MLNFINSETIKSIDINVTILDTYVGTFITISQISFYIFFQTLYYNNYSEAPCIFKIHPFLFTFLDKSFKTKLTLFTTIQLHVIDTLTSQALESCSNIFLAVSAIGVGSVKGGRGPG